MPECMCIFAESCLSSLLSSSRCLFLLPCVRSLLIYSFLCGVSNKSWKLSECRTEPHLKLADLSSSLFTSVHSSMTDVVLKKEAIHWEWEEKWRMKDDWFTSQWIVGFCQRCFIAEVHTANNTHHISLTALNGRANTVLFDLCLLYLCLGVCDSLEHYTQTFNYKGLFVWPASALSWAVIGWELRAYTWLVRQLLQESNGVWCGIKTSMRCKHTHTHTCTCSL